MSAVIPPPQTRIIGHVRIGQTRVPVEVETVWWDYLSRGLYLRAGGATGPSTTELQAQIDALTEGHVIEDEGAPLGQRETINFVGAGVTATDSGTKTVVTIPGVQWTEIEVDFGSSPVYTAAFTITDAGIDAASKVQVLPCGKAATGRTADDWEWDGATFAANPGSGSATCYAVFSPGPIVGRRKVQYSIGA